MALIVKLKGLDLKGVVGTIPATPHNENDVVVEVDSLSELLPDDYVPPKPWTRRSE